MTARARLQPDAAPLSVRSQARLISSAPLRSQPCCLVQLEDMQRCRPRSQRLHCMRAHAPPLCAALLPSFAQVSLEMLEQLPPYEELRGLEDKLRAENKLTFDCIFNEPTGYYMIKWCE